MDKTGKQAMTITLCAVVLFAALINLDKLALAAREIISLFMPVLIGAIIALFLNVPIRGFENLIRRGLAKKKKTISESKCRALSFLLTVLCIALILLLVIELLVPSLSASAKNISRQAQEKFPQWIAYLSARGIDAAWINKITAEMDIKNILETVSSHAGIIINSVAGAAISTVSMAVSVVFALIIAVYALLDTERISRHAKKLVHAYLRPKWAGRVMRFCTLFAETFKKFLSGQSLEALILGSLMALAFLILGLPYPSVVGVLTAVCALIPYVGAFISFAISVILALITGPGTALECAIVYGVVQFVENQFIYPRVVGGSVGLTPLYTLVAALLGGKLFGIIGILFFIPLAAVIFELIKGDAAQRTGRTANTGGVR